MKKVATLVVVPKENKGVKSENYYCGNCHTFLAKIIPTGRAQNVSEFFFKEIMARLHKPCPICGIQYGRVSEPGPSLTLKDCFRTWEVPDDWTQIWT